MCWPVAVCEGTVCIGWVCMYWEVGLCAELKLKSRDSTTPGTTLVKLPYVLYTILQQHCTNPKKLLNRGAYSVCAKTDWCRRNGKKTEIKLCLPHFGVLAWDLAHKFELELLRINPNIRQLAMVLSHLSAVINGQTEVHLSPSTLLMPEGESSWYS